MEEKGLVQVRIWVEKQDEGFIKYISKFCRDDREKKRVWHRTSDHQIKFAKAIASAKNISEPDHLYDYHINLAAWTWCYGAGKYR